MQNARRLPDNLDKRIYNPVEKANRNKSDIEAVTISLDFERQQIVWSESSMWPLSNATPGIDGAGVKANTTRHKISTIDPITPSAPLSSNALNSPFSINLVSIAT
jgi:hypothetical protein